MKKGDKVRFKLGNGSVYTIERIKSVGVHYPTDMVYLQELVGRFYLDELELTSNQIDEQTIMFWYLQLQFMARSSRSLVDVWQGIRFGGMYSSPFSMKMYELVRKGCYDWTEDEHNCLATHLAIQLSGIEE